MVHALEAARGVLAAVEVAPHHVDKIVLLAAAVPAVVSVLAAQEAVPVAVEAVLGVALDAIVSVLAVRVAVRQAVPAAAALVHLHVVPAALELALPAAHKVVEQDVHRVHRPVDLDVKVALRAADQDVRSDAFRDVKGAVDLDANIIVLLNAAHLVT